MNDWTSTLPGIAGAIVAEALRVGEVTDDEWVAKRIGMSAAKDRRAFADILPSPATWYAALKVPYSYSKGQTKGVSTCGLVAVGIMDRAGLPLGWGEQPYGAWVSPVTGKTHHFDVVSQLSQLGYDAHARRPAGVYPQPGDVCCIGRGLATHVLTVVNVDGHTVWSVDGGQVDETGGYLQCIKLLKRDWRGLPIQWMIDTTKLLEALTPA